jgi:hypothetical protein
MAHDIFITYSSRDKSVADAACATLESKHIRCWIAPRDVLPGTEWAEAIVDAIDGSRVLVLILSSNSNSSPQVIREVGRAASNGIPIVPFRIDDVSLSKAMEFFVSAHHWLDAQTPTLEKHLERLADTVHQLLVQQDEVTEETEELPVPTGKPEVKPAAVEVPSAKIAKEAIKQRKWIKPVLKVAGSAVIIAVIAVVLAQRFGSDEELTKPQVTTPEATQESQTTTSAVVQEPPTTTSKQETSPETSTFVTFPDKNLEALIRTELGKQAGDEIVANDLTYLGGLDASRQGIVDLTGIEYCVNLENLNLLGNSISDISVLSSLTKLYELNLHRNQVSDISALSPLTNLTKLYLLENNISDIRALSSLTSLTMIDLGGNSVSDISSLSSLTNLTVLYLWENNIKDISSLSSLTSLTLLHLPGNQISDVSDLAVLTNLTELCLDANNITDISPLASLTNLTELSLGGNRISDIQALSSLTNLTFLNLENNQISDIQPLLANSGLSEGDTVALRNNPLSSTSVNEYIPQLEQRGVTVEFD